MHKIDLIWVVILSVFAAILLVYLLVALRAGKAQYGSESFYVERGKRPIMFWLVVTFMVAVLMDAGYELASQFSN